MRHAAVAALLPVVAPATARAETCEYPADYQSPDGSDASCFIDADAPEGCPVRFLVPRGETPRIELRRDGAPVETTTSFVVEAPIDGVILTKDFLSCTCDPVTRPIALDAVAVTIDGAREGDEVIVDSAGPVPATIPIGPPAACVAPAWPTTFRQLAACDLCPTDEPDDEDPQGGDGGGCHVATPGAPVAAMLLLGLRRRRRRRRRAARGSSRAG